MAFKLTPENAPKNIPLADTAVLSPRVQWHLCLAKEGEVILIFPRATPYARIHALAEKYEAEIYKCKARVSYEMLGENEYYDHNPKVTL